MTERIVPAMDEALGLAAVTEDVALGPGMRLRINRPKEPGVLLDLDAVYELYNNDEYMPYWATLWPVAKLLAMFMLGDRSSASWAPPPPGARALELGCGLGLPGCAALQLGLHVTFTDYDESALEWAKENARLNMPASAPDAPLPFRVVALDWRTPPTELFDLVIASDVIYESRNVGPLVATFVAVLAPGGTALVADQNRPYAEEFKRALAANGFVYAALPLGPHPAVDHDVTGTLYVVRHG